jgi:hypothetical protein
MPGSTFRKRGLASRICPTGRRGQRRTANALEALGKLPARRDFFFREFALPAPALQLDEHVGLLRRVEQVLADLVVRAGRVKLHNWKARMVEQIEPWYQATDEDVPK